MSRPPSPLKGKPLPLVQEFTSLIPIKDGDLLPRELQFKGTTERHNYRLETSLRPGSRRFGSPENFGRRRPQWLSERANQRII